MNERRYIQGKVYIYFSRHFSMPLSIPLVIGFLVSVVQEVTCRLSWMNKVHEFPLLFKQYHL